ncbi:response regulator transcription factor [Novosphingobium sp.]|uniref:response regulator transcription factor n=1 Tax=Novosphingobium sp. TaxID=1874826 RepID=UPI002736F722|nr:LuxR C-terminal-related transcriptional regulator [Novosphingobium sp.]MDP3908402.1 LuxR C-terminal-related transcriptional regulator [Novosphingobium sp.]
MTQRTNLSLVDNDLRRRASISHALAGTPIHVEPFEHLDELVARWPRDGLILIHDDGQNVQRAIKMMTDLGQWLPLVAYGANPGTNQVVQAVLNGAIDYLEWPFGLAEVRQALIVAEESSGSLGTVKLREAMARSRVQRLTKREREVLAGVADGLSNRLIGERLAISPRTVEIHRANMLNKMGANHTSEAIRIAIEASLVG